MINEIFGLVIESPVFALIGPFVGAAIISTVGSIIGAFASERPKEPTDYQGKIMAEHVARLRKSRANRVAAINFASLVTGLPKSHFRSGGEGAGTAESVVEERPQLDITKGALVNTRVGDILIGKEDGKEVKVIDDDGKTFTVEFSHGGQVRGDISELAKTFDPKPLEEGVKFDRSATSKAISGAENKELVRGTKAALTGKSNPNFFVELSKPDEDEDDDKKNPFSASSSGGK